MNAVASLYDALHSFEKKKRKGAFPVHKQLGNNPNYLIEFISRELKFSKGDQVLDAGCGNGHVLISLANQYGIGGLGISISEKEVQSAQQNASEFKMGSIEFKIASFDSPVSGKFTHGLAIESLTHSENLKQAISNIDRVLVKGGKLIIADDFPVKRSKDELRHKALWQRPSFNSNTALYEHLTELGYTLAVYHLTDKVPRRNPFTLSVLIITLSLYLSIFPKRNINFSTFLGALLLERMYQNKEVEYLVIIASKP